jgi:preprotein translocase subunit SecA
VNEKEKIVNLTAGCPQGREILPHRRTSDPENLEIQHNIILALRATT